MALTKGIEFLALQIQHQQEIREAAMMHGGVRSQLADAVQSAHADGGYGYYVDHSGDGTSGDVIYQSNGKLKKTSYAISKTDGKLSASIAHDKAKNVTAITSYKESDGLDARESCSSDNQGAARGTDASLGGNPSASGTVNRETLHNPIAEGVRFIESVGFGNLIRLKESAGGNPLLKIISAGRGSSGYYTEALLKRDGPAIFKRGTLGFINHATQAEETARPEGDWSKIGWVTTGNAYWDESGRDGPALYAPVMLNNKYAEEIKQLAPHTGASIRASGQYAEAAGNGLTKNLAESKIAPDGKPGLIGKLTHADSIDIVTKAGRDGKLLLESANEGENEMDKAEIQALIKESVTTETAPLRAENKQLREMLAATRAPSLISEHLKDIRLPDTVKNKIVQGLALSVPMNESGSVDDVKLKAMVEAAATEWGKTLSELGYKVDPRAVGTPVTEADRLKEAQQHDEAFTAQSKESAEHLADIFVGPANGDKLREAARKSFIEGRVN